MQRYIIDQYQTLTINDILDRLLTIVGENVINTLENIVLTVFDIVKIVFKVIDGFLNTRWNIPVITYVYEKLICKGDGSQLSLLDAVSLLAARKYRQRLSIRQ